MVDNSVKLVLAAVSDLPTGTALTVLQRAADALMAMQRSSETGEPLTHFIDVEIIESTAGLPAIIAELLAVEPHHLAAAAIAEAALKCRLFDLSTAPTA